MSMLVDEGRIHDLCIVNMMNSLCVSR